MSPDFFIRAIEIALGIGVLVMIHEFGHFIAAKWAGVRVDKFALGMGPKICGFVRGETEYSLRWIPVGGFVQMAGEEPGSVTEAAPERQHRNAKPGKKAVIAVAGSFMNLILGVLLFAIAYGVGVSFPRPIIGIVQPGSPAEKAGLCPGDEIVAVNGDRDVDWQDVNLEIVMTGANDNVTLTVIRDGKEMDVVARPRISKEEGLPLIGIQPASGRTVCELDKDGAAAAAGLREGDVIETMDGVRHLRWEDVQTQLSARVGKPVTFVVTRDGKTQTVMVTPRPAQRGTIGLMPATFPRVTMLDDKGPATAAGVKVRDEILAVGGQPTALHEDVIVATAAASGQPTVYRLRRDNETLDVTITPTVRPGETRGRIGIGFEVAGDPVVGAVQPGSPAEAAKIRPGDTLTRIGSTSLKGKTWAHVQELLDDAARKGGKVKISRRSGTVVWPAVEIAVKSERDPLRTDIGFTVEAAERKFYRYAPWRAPGVGLKKSWRVVRQGYFTVKGMVTRSLPLKHAAGPVGIIRFSYAAAAEGLPKFIFWLAFLSVNFAVVNLVPFPPLDGVLILLAGVEKVRGKPVSEKFLVYFLVAGWVVILSLIMFITFNDVRR